MRLCLESFFAVGANVGVGHDDDISNDQHQQNRNGNKIPRNLTGFAKPVDLAGGKRERHGQQKQQRTEFFHCITAFHEYIVAYSRGNVKMQRKNFIFRERRSHFWLRRASLGCAEQGEKTA